ncbi:hypothetical protein CDL15_Pgr026380 [Punica granatum]|nr:hypothetical protein CDL15_Pgr026380 [Punica granatum]
MAYAMKLAKLGFEESFLFFTFVFSLFFNLLSSNSSPHHCNSKLCVLELDRVCQSFRQTLFLRGLFSAQIQLIGRMVSSFVPHLPLIADGVPLPVRNLLMGRQSATSGLGEAEKRQKEKRKLEPVEILRCSKKKRKLGLQSAEVTDE